MKATQGNDTVMTGDQRRVAGLTRSIERLFDELREARDDSVTVSESPPTAGESPSPPAELPAAPMADTETLSSTGRAFTDAVARYLRSSGGERSEAAEAVREGARECREANEIEVAAQAFEDLLVQPVPDPDATQLAAELLWPAVETRIAVRVGGERLEGRREALIRGLLPLGASMAEAVGKALSETDDRHVRRNLIATLVAMGEVGWVVAQSMLSDGRWWVARNGVVVTGETGRPNFVSALTSSLAHDDPRVRREAVRALARIGGSDAGDLAAGMLGDPDPDVRTGAARAVGALKVEHAVRPLLTLLAEEADDGVVEQVLRALGQIGDPGAVIAIEKRAVGGFFSRPHSDIRVAAYVALQAIGSPHAMTLVNAAAHDKDAEVREAVRTLLRARF